MTKASPEGDLAGLAPAAQVPAPHALRSAVLVVARHAGQHAGLLPAALHATDVLRVVLGRGLGHLLQPRRVSGARRLELRNHVHHASLIDRCIGRLNE